MIAAAVLDNNVMPEQYLHFPGRILKTGVQSLLRRSLYGLTKSTAICSLMHFLAEYRFISKVVKF
jgi:hypothetical protein